MSSHDALPALCCCLVLLGCDGDTATGRPGLTLVHGGDDGGGGTAAVGWDAGGATGWECEAQDATADTPICACTISEAVDLTASSAVTVQFTGKYTPRCLKVKVDTTVTWKGNFLAHPLWPSACAGDVADNPIHDVSDFEQTSLAITFPKPGFFPYYCPDHASDTPSPNGMCGVVYVVP
ncbi:MAG: hypothetical protein IT377_05835 [Polyangiaceae bacterium]|nr:hypothetical protein [Polyangiaceae bacterium]